MLYQDLDLFKKYIKKSFPDNLDKIFFVAMQEDFERNRIIEYISCFLPKNDMLSKVRFCAKDGIEKVIEALDTLSFFEGNIIIVEDVDQYLKKDIQKFVSYLRNNLINHFLILSAKNKKNLLTLFSEVSKKGVALDLTLEKKWQKEKRMKRFIKEEFAKVKKSLSQEAIDIFLEKIGLDMAFLEKEIEKTIAYVGEKEFIEKNDIQNICSTLKKNTIWEIAEEIIWKEGIFDLEEVDSSFFYSLIGAMRYQLREGYKLIYLEKFSKFSEKKREKAIFLGGGFFQEALKLLFSIEVLSKSNVTSYRGLLDSFKAKLNLLKTYETDTFSKSFR